MPRASIEYMNRARDLHRARGTTGGKGNARCLSAAELAHHTETLRSPHRIAAARFRDATIDAIEQYRAVAFGIIVDDWSALCPPF